MLCWHACIFFLLSFQCFFCSFLSWFFGGGGIQTVNCLSLALHFCRRTGRLAMCMESRVMQILCMQGGDTVTMQRAKTNPESFFKLSQALLLSIWTSSENLLNIWQNICTILMFIIHRCFQLPRFSKCELRQIKLSSLQCCTLHSGWMNAKHCRNVFSLFNKVKWATCTNAERNLYCLTVALVFNM